MKYLHLALLLLIITNRTHAQTSTPAAAHQGTIRYERKADVHRHLRDEQMKAMVPQFQTASFDLFFNDSISTYKAVPKDEAPDPFDNPSGGGARVIMRFGASDDGVIYRNFASNSSLEETTLEEKRLVVSDSIFKLPWKLTGETTTLLNHPCKKATATSNRGARLIAWYSEDLPVPVGPDRFSGLPGAILKLDVDSASIVFTATQIQATAKSKDLQAPAGKPITKADYDKKLDDVLGPADAQGRRVMRRTN
ncbi:MAG: GLPGLI family protein [Bacteroidetes bacterium]|nr:GLPGLI family protein [Bacteroidota bacterium]